METKKKKQQHKPIEKHDANRDATTSASTSQTKITPSQGETYDLVKDKYKYLPRIKKWEHDVKWLLAYFQNVPPESPDFRYQAVNDTIERIETEKLRHDLRPIGQVISQRDGEHYFFTFGQSNTKSINVILTDKNGKKQEGRVDIAINEKGEVYHQLFNETKSETIFQREAIDIDEFEVQQEEPWKPASASSTRSLYKDIDGTYVVDIIEQDGTKSLRILKSKWKK